MLYIYNTSTDPYFNLAAEEYILHNLPDTFMLWVNRDVIVVGNNQNTLAEINADYVREQGIAVVRRLTGGGAVFHDKGNLNYTFIQTSANEHSGASGFVYFGGIITGALETLGLRAELSGRNDLTIDGMKFSGTAQTTYKDRVLHHGTLMLELSVDRLANALNVSKSKIQGKGIASVRSRVTNINSHLDKPITVDKLADIIAAHIRDRYPDIRPYRFSEEDLAEINKLADKKYRTWEWNYGSSPRYNFSKDSRCAAGCVQVRMEVLHGHIESIRIYGDYFGKRDVSEVERALIGCAHDHAALEQRLSGIPAEEFFFSASNEDLLEWLI